MRRTVTSRVSAGHVVMVVAGVLGVLLTLRLLSTADEREPVVVAAVDLQPGTVIDDDVLTTARVAGDSDVVANLFEPDDIRELRGRVVVAAVPAGALLTAGDVMPMDAGNAPRAMSFPISAARAVAGGLDAGDRVDVIAVDGDGIAKYVMTAAEVLGVDRDDDGPLTGGDGLTVTLAVDEESALALASALDAGTVTLVRATGAA